MTPPASARCAHCGAEISPAAWVCGFCQKPVGLAWLLRPIMSGLFGMLVLGLLAAVTLWLNTSLRLVVAARQTVAALTAKAQAPAPAEPDPQYAGMLAQAEREVSRGDHRMAIAWLMQAASSRPDRPEAHSRMEALRVELMKNLPPSTIPNAPPAPPPTPAGTAAAPAADLAAIPGGPFTMGASAPGGSPDEYPAHKVILPPFSLETREVTVESYRKFCAETGRKPPPQPGWSSPQHPVVSVTWRDAQDYCRRKGRRLPTEAEWERAARCGAALRYANGDSPQSINPYAWSVENSGGRAHAVATRLPGSCSLLDAYGNVWEWTADWYSANYYDNSPERDPRGPRYGEEKVLRGGAFDSPLAALGATFRDKFSPDYGAENRGFRCARSQPR